MTYWDVPQGRAVLRVSAGAPMHGSKARAHPVWGATVFQYRQNTLSMHELKGFNYWFTLLITTISCLGSLVDTVAYDIYDIYLWAVSQKLLRREQDL